jgi:lipoprotein NlpD
MAIRLIMVLFASLLIAGCTTTQRSARRTACANYTPYAAARSTAPCADEVVIENVAMAQTVTNATVHTVKPGETLWSISKMYNVNLDSLAKANSITDARVIEKGQVLTIPTAAKAPSRPTSFKPAKTASFAWPVRGPVISRFGENTDGTVNKGMDIRAAHGQDVVAAKAGRVVYCDSYFKGFGQTVIVDHADGYQTVYSYNSDILVKVGDMVRQNEVIAKAGQSGRAQEPMLHFEIRCNGEPQDPIRYLSD